MAWRWPSILQVLYYDGHHLLATVLKELSCFTQTCDLLTTGKMDSLNKRLEQLNKEIAEVIAKADNAQQAYEMERGPVQEGKLKIIWEQRLKDKEMLLPMLLKQRKSLEDHLPFPGVHNLLVPFNCSESAAVP